jgi:hypothetical protein
MDRTKALRAVGSGFAGAAAVTLLNESARRVIPRAPRLDALGMRAIARGLRAAGQEPPHGERLRGAALAGDLVSNTLYYSLAGAAGGGRNAWLLGSLLGLGAGAGAAFLPPQLSLGHQPGETSATRVMTIAWYLAGGLAAAGVFALLSRGDRKRPTRK